MYRKYKILKYFIMQFIILDLKFIIFQNYGNYKKENEINT